MYEHRKSDSPVVPAKSPNNAASAVAEAMEERGLAKDNAAGKTRPGHRAGAGALSALDRVRQVHNRIKEHGSQRCCTMSPLTVCGQRFGRSARGLLRGSTA